MLQVTYAGNCHKTTFCPSKRVVLALQAVCVLRDEKPDWDTAKKVLGEPAFMRSLLEFDKDNIPEGVIRKLRRYVARPTMAAVIKFLRGLA